MKTNRQVNNIRLQLGGLLVLSALASSAVHSQAVVSKTETFARELQSLAGTWKPVSTENNGYSAAESDLQGMRWIRNADGNWSMRRGDDIVVGWTIKTIDATKAPKTIDIEVATGPYKGIVYLGIYDLDGDTSRICFALPDRPVRPTEFSAGSGTVRACSTFRRESD